MLFIFVVVPITGAPWWKSSQERHLRSYQKWSEYSCRVTCARLLVRKFKYFDSSKWQIRIFRTGRITRNPCEPGSSRHGIQAIRTACLAGGKIASLCVFALTASVFAPRLRFWCDSTFWGRAMGYMDVRSVASMAEVLSLNTGPIY